MRRYPSILIAALVLATSLAACGSDDDDAQTGADATSTSIPEYAGKLESDIEKIMQDRRVPSAVVVVKSQSKGDWTGTFGTRTLDGGDPPTVDDHYRIGSITKTMTGTIVLQLVQEGKLGLDDPVSKYRPEAPGGDKITIRHLLEMRSGLYNFLTDEALVAQLNEQPGKAFPPSELLAISFDHPLSFPPGEEFEYSNSNTVLLGEIIEEVTGRSFKDELQLRIFDPLELRDTTYPAPADASIPSPHPQGYDYDLTATSPAELEAQARGEVKPDDVTDFNFPSGADGRVISTARDLARYAEALGDGRLLDPELQRERIASIKPVRDFVNSAYGMAIAGDGPWLGHGGVVTGFNTVIGRDPQERNTVVVLTSTQLRLTPEGGLILPAYEILDAVSIALYGEAPGDPAGREMHPFVPR